MMSANHVNMKDCQEAVRKAKGTEDEPYEGEISNEECWRQSFE